jgi:hypothetical protein
MYRMVVDSNTAWLDIGFELEVDRSGGIAWSEDAWRLVVRVVR